MTDPRTGYNNLSVEVYSSGTTRLIDMSNDLDHSHVKVNSFATQYPGGLYSDANIFVPRDVVRSWLVNGGQRIVIRNGLSIVWEGDIDALPTTVDKEYQGIGLNCIGKWGTLLNRRTLDKRWSDQRLTEATWVVDTTAPGANIFVIDRYNRIRFSPNNQSLPASTYAAVTYTAPTCQLIYYIGFNFSFQEQAKSLELRLRDTTASVTLASIITSGSGTCAITPASPRNSFQFQFMADTAAASPLESGSYFGQITNIDLRCASGNIISASLVKDVAANCTGLNSDTSKIGTNNFGLTPFITDKPEALTSILNRIASYGDASYNAWACYVDNSETAQTPDGTPVLAFEQQPALTDYDYAIRLDEENVQPPINIVRDFGDIVNWVTVRYRDALNNRDVILTPNDDANLKDTASITAYGERHLRSPIDVGQASATTATNIARRYLAAWKDPKYYISGPIKVVGYIRAKSGQEVPSSQIRAGKRLKIENYLQDLSGTGLTVLITGTNYSDYDESCSIMTGVPDNLSVFEAQRSLLDDRVLF